MRAAAGIALFRWYLARRRQDGRQHDHGDEEGYPVGSQQGAGQAQHRQIAQGEGV